MEAGSDERAISGEAAEVPSFFRGADALIMYGPEGAVAGNRVSSPWSAECESRKMRARVSGQPRGRRRWAEDSVR